MKEHLKGSLGPKLNDLRFQVMEQANELLERILDLETNYDNLKKIWNSQKYLPKS